MLRPIRRGDEGIWILGWELQGLGVRPRKTYRQDLLRAIWDGALQAFQALNPQQHDSRDDFWAASAFEQTGVFANQRL